MAARFADVDGIEVELSDPARLRTGAIIVFRRENHWIVHRVVRVFRKAGGPVCITKGDGVSRFDPLLIRLRPRHVARKGCGHDSPISFCR